MFELPSAWWPMEVVGSAGIWSPQRRLLHSRLSTPSTTPMTRAWVNQPTASVQAAWCLGGQTLSGGHCPRVDLSAMPGGTYVDVGCGSGRDAVLAQALQAPG